MKDVQGFRFPNSPIRWVLEYAINKAVTMEQLLQRFYDLFSEEDEHPFAPLAFVRDPEEEGRRIYGYENVIVAPFRREYYCVITKQLGDIYGPHPCRLYMRNGSETLWIAILQISEMFYSDERMLNLLKQSIKDREFYQSESTKKDIVTLQ